MKNPKVALFETETIILHSKIVDQDFELYISFPFGYSKSDKTYPVLFCLDANRCYGIVYDAVKILSKPSKEIPEVLLVGIGYPMKGLEDWVIGRQRDYTPTSKPEHDKYWIDRLNKETDRNDLNVQSGGADKFFAFLCEELIPYIETNYRVSTSDRALMGYSLSGLFVLHVLFQNPNIFRRYFAGSPAIDWDEPFVLKCENDFAAANEDLSAKLFMSAAGLESKLYIDNMKRMAELLRSRNYKSLELETHIFEDETHPSCLPCSISRALRILYKD